jgi:hypothetical protein
VKRAVSAGAGRRLAAGTVQEFRQRSFKLAEAYTDSGGKVETVGKKTGHRDFPVEDWTMCSIMRTRLGGTARFKQERHPKVPFFNLGGPGRNRTTDTRIFNPLLEDLEFQIFSYQIS